MGRYESILTTPTFAQGPNSGDDLVAPDTFVPGRSYRVSFTYDGTTGFLYIDGRLVSAAAWLPPKVPRIKERELGIVPECRGDVVVGTGNQRPAATAWGGDVNLKALVDDLRFWSRRITPREITSRMHRELTATEIAALAEDGLAAYYTFDNRDHQNPPQKTTRIVYDRTASDGAHGFVYPNDAGALPSQTNQTTWIGLRENGVTLPYRQGPAIELQQAAQAVRITTAPFDITFQGNTYRGVGGLGSVSDVEDNANLEPVSIDLTISGLDPSYLSLALDFQTHGRPATLWGVYFEPNSATIAGEPFFLFRGQIDTMRIDAGEDASITVSVTSELAGWNAGEVRRWNDVDQQARFPGDHCFEFIATLPDKEVWWPQRFAGDGTT